MTWRSPWNDPAWVRSVAAARGSLRVQTGSDHDLVRVLVEEQNARVETWVSNRTLPCRDVLLILPRCVKRKCCTVGADGALAACLDCRRCALGELARLADGSGVRAIVAFRSHLAYAAARRDRPDLIIATACEDRLIKAMASVPDIPAYLTPLTGMERMCVNAVTDVAWIGARLAVAGKGSHAAKPVRTQGV